MKNKEESKKKNIFKDVHKKQKCEECKKGLYPLNDCFIVCKNSICYCVECWDKS